MNALESWTLAYLLNSLWQVPLVFVAAWIAARAVRRRSVAMEHRIWVSALALEALLPACSFQPAESFLKLRQLMRLWGAGAAGGEVRVTSTPGAALAHGALRLPPGLLAVIGIAYAGSIVYFAGRLIWGLRQTGAMRRRAERIVLIGDTQKTWARCCRFFRVDDAQAAVSGDVDGPVTIGILRRMLLLPAGWQASLSGEDLDAAIAHEFAHMHRRDFAKNLLYELLSLPIAYHPLLWLTRARITESREMVCDAMAADAVAGREKYARSLLRLASTLTQKAPARTLHAIGIFDANIFERRVMNLTENRIELRGVRRFATAAVCVLLGLGTCASALALRMGVSAPAPQNESQPAQPGVAAKVSGHVMALQILTQVNPIYPPKARAEKISGIVVLHTIIGKDGTIKSVDVISGPEEFREAAVDAVRQWTYRPYLLNGNPTEVDTNVSVTFQVF